MHPASAPGATAFYEDWAIAPPWLVGALGALALVAVAALRRRLAHRREVLLLAGMGLVVLLGSAATSEWQSRHLVSVTAVIVAGGMLALSEAVG